MKTIAKKVATAILALALVAGGYKACKNSKKTQNIQNLVGTVSELCDKKGRLNELESQYTYFLDNKDKIYTSFSDKECKVETENERTGKKLAFYTNKEINGISQEINGLDSKLKGLDKKISEISLDTSRFGNFEAYATFKRIGYIYLAEKDPVFLKIENEKNGVYYCRSETKGFKGHNKGRTALTPFVCGDIVIDMNKIEDTASKLSNNWKKIIENNSLFEKDDKKWEPHLQVLYNTFKTAQNIPEKYKGLELDEDIIHEKQHIDDYFKNYNESEKETRAYLRCLMNSPLSLNTLEGAVLDKKANKSCREAAEKIISGFMSFPDMKSKKDIYRLSNAEITQRAKRLFAKWY